MRTPKIVIPESCAWCNEPKQGHAQHWHSVGGWHGWTAPSKGLIEARMRRNFQIKGLLPTDPMDPAYRASLVTVSYFPGGEA